MEVQDPEVGCSSSAQVVLGVCVTEHGSPSVTSGDLTAELADAFSHSSRIAWDVETSGLDWQHDRLGTCQIFADDVGVVVVRSLEGAPERLAALLGNPAVEKIFHHAPFDLRFMSHAWSIRPASIRCTKVASKLLSPNLPNSDHSLQSLALRYLGIYLPKGPVRTSDWTTAHLSRVQIEYATRDVIHLPKLFDVLAGEIRARGLEELYNSCCDFLPALTEIQIGGYPDVFAY
jgi:ribonuclease D